MTVLRGILRIALGLLVVCILLITVLALVNPDGAKFLAAALIDPFVGIHDPPPIARGVILKSDWMKYDAAGSKFTAVLRRRFPVGSSEQAMREELMSQGFTAEKSPSQNCIPAGQQWQQGRAYEACPADDWRRTMEYRWGTMVCTEFLTVHWSVDRKGRLIGVKGYYGNACL